MSGSTNVTPTVGCQERSARGLPSFCYVSGGEKCATVVTLDMHFAGPVSIDATASLAFPSPPAGQPGAAYRTCTLEACRCTKTGLSGGVRVEAIGCADHFNDDTLPWYEEGPSSALCIRRSPWHVGFRAEALRQVLRGGWDSVCDGHTIVEASRSGHQGMRRLHLHPDGDFKRRCI